MPLIRTVPWTRAVLPLVALIVLATWIRTIGAPDSPQALLLGDLHWTLAYAVAAWMTWRSARVAGISAQQRLVRGRFAAAMLAQVLGQVAYDIESYLDWWPLPGPDDFFFLLYSPLFLYGFAGIVGGALPASRRRPLLLDVASFALAVLALALTLYLPQGRQSNVLQVVDLVSYPVLVLSTAATAIVLQLHLRLHWNARWIALLGGLWGSGIAQMVWLLQIQAPQLRSALNLGYSAFALLLGWGAAGWHPQPDRSPGFDRICEGFLRQIPLFMVAMASAAIGLLVLGQNLSESVRLPLLALDLSVLLFAVFRQTQQLGERDRLIEAERVVLESQAKLEHLAHHDPLTGLPNLILLRDRVQQALTSAARRNTRVALLFLDMDQFKEVNDTLGHATGDALLRHVAGLLQNVVRATDTVSRQGGDEFVIVLPDLDEIGVVTRVIQKVMELSAGTTQIGGYELLLSMSAGVALYPDDAADFDSLLQCADTAMYRAKAAGRSAYRFYDAQMNAESADRIHMRTRLARAIERGELHLYYQPLIEIDTGKVCGAEALLRWSSPEAGEVPPASFIALAEDTGLIVEIGGWVLMQACQRASAWGRLGLPPVRLAVNVSVLQFRRGNLEAQVVAALSASGLAPRWLELEVTESVLMQDQDRVIATLERLSELGVGIAIDDFGTGYSSLSYVKRMQAGKIKIDRSFVHDATQDGGGAAIVRAMIEMARALNVITVAEGVESDAQLAFLRDCRCDLGQGYLFARPMPPEDFARYLAEHA